VIGLAFALALLASGEVGPYVAPPDGRMPRLSEVAHFVNYVEPLVGQEQAAMVTAVFPPESEWYGAANLLYFTANPADPENPPPHTEFKFKRWRDVTGTPNTWHYPEECPSGL
jgi:hypothetical protein